MDHWVEGFALDLHPSRKNMKIITWKKRWAYHVINQPMRQPSWKSSNFITLIWLMESMSIHRRSLKGRRIIVNFRSSNHHSPLNQWSIDSMSPVDGRKLTICRNDFKLKTVQRIVRKFPYEFIYPAKMKHHASNGSFIMTMVSSIIRIIKIPWWIMPWLSHRLTGRDRVWVIILPDW